jgi:hypothetical protein
MGEAISRGDIDMLLDIWKLSALNTEGLPYSDRMDQEQTRRYFLIREESSFLAMISSLEQVAKIDLHKTLVYFELIVDQYFWTLS